MKLGLGMVLVSGLATDAPKSVSINVQNGHIFEVARQLSTQSGCRVSAFGVAVASSKPISIKVQNGRVFDLTWAFERLGSRRDQFGLPVAQRTPAAFKASLGCDRAPSSAATIHERFRISDRSPINVAGRPRRRAVR